MNSEQFFSTGHSAGKRSNFSKEIESKKKRKKLEEEFGDEEEEDDDENEAKEVNLIPLEEGEEEEERENNKTEETAIEPFNLKQERRNGKFDEKSGGYQQTRGEKETEEVDAWVLEYEEKEKEGKIQSNSSSFVVPQRKINFFEETDVKDANQLQRQLIAMLREGESPRKALHRLSNQQKEFRKTKEREKLEESKKMFDGITECASDLQTIGFHDILDDRVEVIHSRLNRLKEDAKETKEKRAMWEYRDNEGRLQGPFSSEQMLGWVNQGYFLGESSVMVRKVEEEDDDDIFSDSPKNLNPFISSSTIDFAKS
eukprot:TRINITY_DN1584_c0_g1_i1.p1 TRINITY_DN1584_c0_g1~~TRINITY_DN1584_c0_g1_i1.p1  ORF type:complete len:313 (+),score=127.70 TRINITY_DN1584_c0_g1_i1:40-978(+)